MNRRAASLTALAVLVAALSIAAAWPADDETAGPLDPLSFMTGTWVMRTPDMVLEETWSAADGQAMVGMLRWHRGGELFLYELLSIEARGDDPTPTLRLRHFSPALEPWSSEATSPALSYPLASVDGTTATFENPELFEPGRMVYTRTDDALTIDLVYFDEQREVQGAQRFSLELAD